MRGVILQIITNRSVLSIKGLFSSSGFETRQGRKIRRDISAMKINCAPLQSCIMPNIVVTFSRLNNQPVFHAVNSRLKPGQLRKQRYLGLF